MKKDKLLSKIEKVDEMSLSAEISFLKMKLQKERKENLLLKFMNILANDYLKELTANKTKNKTNAGNFDLSKMKVGDSFTATTADIQKEKRQPGSFVNTKIAPLLKKLTIEQCQDLLFLLCDKLDNTDTEWVKQSE